MTRTLEISEETYQKIKDQLSSEENSLTQINSIQELVGKKIFVRTVTYHIVGRVTKVIGNLVFLESASWIPDSGRFTQFIKDGKLNEVEPVGNWFINFNTVVDGCIWAHPLPTLQK